jgi:nitrogen fixation-related uncharacterized protein
MDILAKLLFLIALLLLLAVALGMLGVVGRALHWVLDSWSGDDRDRR